MVPLTDKVPTAPVKVTVSVSVPSPNSALPVIVNAKAPPSVELVVTVVPANVLSAPLNVTAPV